MKAKNERFKCPKILTCLIWNFLLCWDEFLNLSENGQIGYFFELSSLTSAQFYDRMLNIKCYKWKAENRNYNLEKSG